MQKDKFCHIKKQGKWMETDANTNFSDSTYLAFVLRQIASTTQWTLYHRLSSAVKTTKTYTYYRVAAKKLKHFILFSTRSHTCGKYVRAGTDQIFEKMINLQNLTEMISINSVLNQKDQEKCRTLLV